MFANTPSSSRARKPVEEEEKTNDEEGKAKKDDGKRQRVENLAHMEPAPTQSSAGFLFPPLPPSPQENDNDILMEGKTEVWESKIDELELTFDDFDNDNDEF